MTRSQMRRENPKPSDAEFWNTRRMSRQESAARLVARSQAAPDHGGKDDCCSDAVTVWFYDLSFTGLLLPWGFAHACAIVRHPG